MTEEYELISVSENESYFVQEVNRMISEGWQPYGDPSFVAVKGGIIYLQAMTKVKRPVVRVKHGAYSQ